MITESSNATTVGSRMAYGSQAVYDVITDVLYGNPTSAMIKTSMIKPPYSSVVLYVNKGMDSKYTVILQYDANTLFKFSELHSIRVKEGQTVDCNFIIGTAKGGVKFEYLTAKKYDSHSPVRVNKVTYYKQNPKTILELMLPTTDPGKLGVVFGHYDPDHQVKWTSDMLKEFKNGKGD